MNVECPDYTIPIAGQLHYASRGDGPPQAAAKTLRKKTTENTLDYWAGYP